MTLKEAWEKSEGRGVFYKNGEYVGSTYVYYNDKMPVGDAMSDRWEPVPPPEPPEPVGLPLAEALRKWSRTRRVHWDDDVYVARTSGGIVHFCCTIGIDSLEATDWVEAP